MRGLKCHKCLYLNKYAKDLRDKTSDSQQYIFDQGKEIGLFAQQLFPNGIDLTPKDYTDYSESISKTAELIRNKEKIIYEAAFLFDDVLCAIDILTFDGIDYRAYEVKSSTSISEAHILDASVQFYIISNCGVNLKDISVIHLNNQYVRAGELNVKELFKIESILAQVLEKQRSIPNNIKTFKEILELKNAPEVKIGNQCFNPYQCDFMGHCWQHIPEHSVFDIANLTLNKKFSLFNNGVIKLSDITDEIKKEYLNDKQIMQIEADLEGRKIIDEVRISNFISDLRYPLYFLDFETMMLAIPIYNNQRPYQQIVFQYSLHLVEDTDVIKRHSEFLADPTDGDPRIKFIERLITDCGSNGDILTYNMSFEKTRLKELIRDFPAYSIQLQLIIDRIKDLMVPFKEYWYYAPSMKGSYSIKKVLPELVPELSYQNIEIKDGGTASTLYSMMVTNSFSGDIENARKNLLTYCHLDTLAMVKILEKLRAI